MFLPFRPLFASFETGHRSIRHWTGLLGGLALWGLLAGCSREEVRTYTVPQESNSASKESTSALPPNHPPVTAVSPHSAMEQPGRPGVAWTLPEGWEELKPNQFRVGNFRVSGPDQSVAEVSIVPLAGQAGSNLANVNRWRGQVGLPPITEQELGAVTQRVTIGGAPGVLFELAGVNPRDQKPTRMLAAISRRGGTAWFIKMVGTDSLVAKQKKTFIQFLADLKFASAGDASEKAAASGPAQPPSPTTKGQAHPAWQPPDNWRAEKAGNLQTAKWSVAGPGGDRATINVSVLSGTGGGVLANVVRWRRQLGLPPIEADQLSQCTTALEGAGEGALLVTLASADGARQMIGAIVPSGDRTWFYKLVGDPAVVKAERDAFVNFVKSAHHAP